MHALLDRFGIKRRDVESLAEPAPQGREVLVSETMRPSTATAQWHDRLERPEIVAYANARNWEIVAHNYEQGELLTKYTFDIDKERQLIAATLAVYEKTVGRKAKGWLSSSLRSTPNTPDLLAEQGLQFFCDYMNDEQPYLISTCLLYTSDAARRRG